MFGFGFNCCCPSYGGYRGYSGYNPGFSDAMAGLGIATSVMNGIANGLHAKNRGATDGQAAFIGMGTALAGTSNACMGSAFDHATHTYWGTSTATFANASLNMGLSNPFMYNPFMYNPFMFTPMAMTNPFMFSSMMCTPYMGGFGFIC